MRAKMKRKSCVYNLKIYSKISGSLKGSSSVIILCTTMLIVILSALTADISYAAFERFTLRHAAISAIKTGLEMLASDRGNPEEVVKKSAVSRINDLNGLDIRIANNKKEISLYIKKPFKYFFLNLFGVKEKELTARVTAKLSTASSYRGIRPIAVEKRQFKYDRQCMLASNPSKSNGNIKILLLDLGNESNDVDLKYGYGRTLKQGDGVFASKVSDFKSIENSLGYVIRKSDRHKLMVLTVVEKLEYSGDKPMNILGFVAFIPEEAKVDGNYFYIKGRFTRLLSDFNTNDAIENFGVSGFKIIE